MARRWVFSVLGVTNNAEASSRRGVGAGSSRRIASSRSVSGSINPSCGLRAASARCSSASHVVISGPGSAQCRRMPRASAPSRPDRPRQPRVRGAGSGVAAGRGRRARSADGRRGEQRRGEFHLAGAAAAQFHRCRCRAPRPGPVRALQAEAGPGQGREHGHEVRVAERLADSGLRVEHEGTREGKVSPVDGQERQAPFGLDVGEAVSVSFGPPARLGQQFPGAVGVSLATSTRCLNEPMDGATNGSSELKGISRSRPSAPPTSPVLYMCSARSTISWVSGGPEASAASSAAPTSSRRPVSSATQARAAERDASAATSFGGQGVEPHPHRLQLPGVERLAPVRYDSCRPAAACYPTGTPPRMTPGW